MYVCIISEMYLHIQDDWLYSDDSLFYNWTTPADHRSLALLSNPEVDDPEERNVQSENISE